MNSFAYTKFLTYKAGLGILLRLRNAGSGYKLAAGTFAGIMGYTYLKGPTIEKEIYRCGLAGIASTLFVEVACQPIDTLNMKSKVDKKFAIFNFLKRKGMTSLMRGIQPVLYGMAVSSFIYFVMYKHFKESVKYRMDLHNIDKTSLTSIFMMSAGASTLANLLAIGIYYPYDLVKTRMQIVGQYNYKNIVDAFYKITNEGSSGWRMRNFFRGFTLYSLTFISFTTLEFSIYETAMMYLSKSNTKAIGSNNSDGIMPIAGPEGIFEHKEDRKMSHILFASAIAGAIGGFVTNPLEFLAVNKQADPNMKVSEVFKKTSVYDIFFKGSLFRTTYYSTQAILIFFLLEKFGNHLNCEI